MGRHQGLKRRMLDLIRIRMGPAMMRITLHIQLYFLDGEMWMELRVQNLPLLFLMIFLVQMRPFER